MLQEKPKETIQSLVDCSLPPPPPFSTPLITLLVILSTLSTACRESCPLRAQAITKRFAFSSQSGNLVKQELRNVHHVERSYHFKNIIRIKNLEKVSF